jgi:hypothetical protein
MVLYWRIRADEKTKAMKPKIALTKEQQIEHWVQLYLQAKQSGDTRIMKICKDVIAKLGGKIPKL